jgi:hypothetical protein
MRRGPAHPCANFTRVTLSEDEARAQTRREAAPSALLVLIAFVAIAVVSQVEGWHLLNLSWWIWLVLAVPALLLTIDLLLSMKGRGVVRSRQAALFLLGVLVLANLFAVTILVAGLLTTDTKHLSGAELLFNAIAIWSANVIVFGLIFWEQDAGGPVARFLAQSRTVVDLAFPQDTDPLPGSSAWRPQAWDYLYVSLTNSIAFSPTDTLPRTLRAKAMMGLESAIAAFTVLLVFARAVNVIAG